jgi:S-adenosylmethionine:tRNA ribosyltransferase-isomerase
MALLSDYDYILPEDAIAQTPLEDRAAAKLLWLHKDGAIEHRSFRDVTQILQPGDLLVLNDTRVTALRLFGQKETGGKVEILLLKQISAYSFEVLAKPAKRLQRGIEIMFANGLKCTVEGDLPFGGRIVRFEERTEFERRLKGVGSVPLPPYIHVPLTNDERYQTVYASSAGSAAAPTAGLHFTETILGELKAKGVETAFVTLDVGLDTFRPVQAEKLEDHQMHGEKCSIPSETASKIENCQGRIIAVGTTAVRTLESFATAKRQVAGGEKTTSIFIRPGYKFQIIDGMFTNFHMPRTTMLMMLSALVGRDRVFHAYQEALNNHYRFLSFGDSMLIL